jgi:preprotein translocase subunit SecG
MKAGVGAAMTRVERTGMVIGQVVVTAAEAQEAMGRRDAQKTVTRTVVTLGALFLVTLH